MERKKVKHKCKERKGNKDNNKTYKETDKQNNKTKENEIEVEIGMQNMYKNEKPALILRERNVHRHRYIHTNENTQNSRQAYVEID